MKYLSWNEENIIDFSEENIDRLYDKGYLFTRIKKGVMQQTRSVRIDIEKFELSSENRRILRKGEEIIMKINPIPYSEYSWSIGKIGKTFYEKKASAVFTANKIKELITTNHNFNTLLSYSDFGYSICYKDKNILHYCYPFYDLERATKDMGLIMMTKAIEFAKKNNIKYVYLGSLQRKNDVYKLQFSGMQWFNGNEWSEDLEEVKNILK